MKKLVFLILTILFSLTLCFIGAEIIIRTKVKYNLRVDERNVLYRYDKELGWFPKDNLVSQYCGSHSISIKHNQLGFRDKEHGQKIKKRIAFIGDSFVYGFDVEQDERFTDKLQKELPNWDVLNLGVNGYGTDQEYLLVQKYFDHFQPDIIFLVVCYNDRADNTSNQRYGGYYKPYFKFKNDSLIQYGTPVPKSLNYYHKNYPIIYSSRLIQYVTNFSKPEKIIINDPTITLLNEFHEYVVSKGAQLIVGFIDHPDNSDLSTSISQNINNFPLLSLTNTYRYPSYGRHWTPDGHNVVKERILSYLINEGIVSQENGLTPNIFAKNKETTPAYLTQ